MFPDVLIVHFKRRNYTKGMDFQRKRNRVNYLKNVKQTRKIDKQKHQYVIAKNSVIRLYM